MKLIDKNTGEVLAEIVGGEGLTFDECCQIANLSWKDYPDVETEGWYLDDDVLVDESWSEWVD